MKTSYIVVPGLGDHRRLFGWFYRLIESQWRRHGLVVRVAAPDWAGAETYQAKYERLSQAIANERQKGREVALVGVSAGAALAYLAFSQQPKEVRAFVAVCGFTRLKPSDYDRKELMDLSWYQAAAAAEQASSALSALERSRILSLIPGTDSVIESKQQYIQGAQNVRLRVSGHVLGIVTVLLWGRRRIERFVTSIGSA